MRNLFIQKNKPGIILVTISLFILLLISFFIFLPTKKVEAVLLPVPTNDASNTQINAAICVKDLGVVSCTPKTLSGLLSSLTNALSSAGSALTSPDFLAYNAAQGAMTAITTQIANSILNAANSFSRDLRRELLDLENDVANKLGLDINVVNTCFPNMNFRPIPLPAWNGLKFQGSISCSSTGGNNLGSLYNTGGFNWEDYRRMALNPKKYNPFGVDIAVKKELAKRTAEADKNEREQLAWGSGFRALSDGVNGIARLPGSVMKNMVDEVFGVQVRKMENADEITEGIGALIQTAVGGIISSKLNGGVYNRYPSY